MFYFSSPRKSDFTKYRPAARQKAKPARQRRNLAKMEGGSQHACVAHFEEPTFCSSELACLIPPFGGAVLPHSARDKAPEVPECSDDEEDGGVPLDPVYHDQLPQQYDSSFTTDFSSSSNDQYLSTPSSLSRSSHARPVSRDIWEEEDGRRLRFALQDADEDEQVRARLVRSDGDRALAGQQQASTIDHVQASLEAWSDQTVTQEDADDEEADEEADESRFPPPARDQNGAAVEGGDHAARNPVHNGTYHHEFAMDEDTLAVDDYRRNYDVADFMDGWRLQWLTNHQVPPCEQGLQSSVKVGRPKEEITRSQVASGEMDMQGLRWDLLGPKREDALRARGIMHPSSNASPSMTGFGSASTDQLDDELHYRFRSFSPRHRARFSHYQLRNVLAASSRSDIFYSVGDRVMQTSLACPTMRDTIMDLSRPSDYAVDFRITCLGATPSATLTGYRSDSLLLAGGFYGEYALHSLHTTHPAPPTEGFVTHAYNGLVTHIHTPRSRTSTTPHAAFCSNDRHLRLLDPTTNRLISSHPYETALNCAATSPDARLRVLVGDSRDTLITDAASGTPLVTLQHHSDHAFACAWAPDGRHVATAAQDGFTLLFDARNWSAPLARLPSRVSCARSLHFAEEGVLVVAENEDVVSVVDARDLGARQDVRFLGCVAGVAVVEGGREVVVANADRSVGGLMSLERTTAGWGKGGRVGRERERERGGGSGRGKGAVEEVLGSQWVADVVV